MFCPKRTAFEPVIWRYDASSYIVFVPKSSVPSRYKYPAAEMVNWFSVNAPAFVRRIADVAPGFEDGVSSPNVFAPVAPTTWNCEPVIVWSVPVMLCTCA